MSFFKDFKEDLSQAVNELMPEEAAASIPEDIQMVDTLTVDTLTDDEDDNEPSIEEMLSNIENINIEKDEAAERNQLSFDPVPELAAEPAAEPEEYIPEPLFEPVKYIRINIFSYYVHTMISRTMSRGAFSGR